MDLRPGVTIDEVALAEFCRDHGIVSLALFGSALGSAFGDDSDLDLLVEFEPDRTPGLIGLATMELCLQKLLGREVDLRTARDLSVHFRDTVTATARTLYAA